MSDIHGHLDILKETLQNVDLTAKNNKLILLGDYINRGDKSCETLYFVKDLSEKYPEQVVALKGNHEEMFLEDISEKNNLFSSDSYNELQSYLSQEELSSIANEFSDSMSMNDNIIAIYKEMVSLIKTKHSEMLYWLKSLPYIYETDTQIFVHAGIDEEAGEYWKWGSEDYYFCSKYPYVMGEFYKDIIAGHIGTSAIANDESFHKVFWDKESHFYIDGTTEISGCIPILKYDINTKQYTSFEKVLDENSSVVWSEYLIK